MVGLLLTQMKGHAAGQELIAKHQVNTERAKADMHRYKLRITHVSEDELFILLVLLGV